MNQFKTCKILSDMVRVSPLSSLYKNTLPGQTSDFSYGLKDAFDGRRSSFLRAYGRHSDVGSHEQHVYTFSSGDEESRRGNSFLISGWCELAHRWLTLLSRAEEWFGDISVLSQWNLWMPSYTKSLKNYCVAIRCSGGYSMRKFLLAEQTRGLHHEPCVCLCCETFWLYQLLLSEEKWRTWISSVTLKFFSLADRSVWFGIRVQVTN